MGAGEGAVMRKQIIENAAFEVATQVRAVEDVIDAALGEIAELQSRILKAVGVTGIPHVRIQSAFDQLSATIGSLVAARANIGGCHVALAEAKQFVPGLRTVSWGDGDGECPPTTGITELKIVA
jgi:predicted urease superfamily metal-dependent hydrolase